MKKDITIIQAVDIDGELVETSRKTGCRRVYTDRKGREYVRILGQRKYVLEGQKVVEIAHSFPGIMTGEGFKEHIRGMFTALILVTPIEGTETMAGQVSMLFFLIFVVILFVVITVHQIIEILRGE